MDDRVSTDLSETALSAAGERSESARAIPTHFDEALYLRAFPDVAGAVKRKKYKSALEHYEQYGEAERRLDNARYRYVKAGIDSVDFTSNGFDTAFITPSGRILVIGWVNDDQAKPLDVCLVSNDRVIAATSEVARCRRQDAEAVVLSANGKLLGFWAVLQSDELLYEHSSFQFAMLVGSQRHTAWMAIEKITDVRFREIVLEYLAGAHYFGNHQIQTHVNLDTGLGTTLLRLNAGISKKITSMPLVVVLGLIERALLALSSSVYMANQNSCFSSLRFSPRPQDMRSSSLSMSLIVLSWRRSWSRKPRLQHEHIIQTLLL